MPFYCEFSTIPFLRIIQGKTAGKGKFIFTDRFDGNLPCKNFAHNLASTLGGLDVIAQRAFRWNPRSRVTKDHETRKSKTHSPGLSRSVNHSDFCLRLNKHFNLQFFRNMAAKSLTPQTVAMDSLKQFEKAMDSLKSAFCLYEECTDLSDPYDDHRQPRRSELRRTYKRKS